jgi:predicted O-methyltransferase YrrM
VDWKTELNAVKKYINSDYIYEVFRKYGFTINGKFLKLDSNINVYEACFISQITKIYMEKYKNKIDKKDKELSILEIGFAYGTSALIFLNQLIKYKNKIRYDIVDMNQSTQWNNLGLKNVDQFLKINKKSIKYNLYEEDSTKALPKLKEKYDIIFIDGGHTEDIVSQDILNSDKLLKKNGIMILDDVLHEGVKLALLSFLKNHKNYVKINISDDFKKLSVSKKVYDPEDEKRSYNNPNSMYAFIRM